MPQYDYKCNKCNSITTEYREVEERDLNLPICCGKQTERTFSTSSLNTVIYKGTGWPIKQAKVDKWYNFVEEVSQESVDPSEVKEGQDMIKERQVVKEQQRISRGTHKLGIE